jgi:hypothetical protein
MGLSLMGIGLTCSIAQALGCREPSLLGGGQIMPEATPTEEIEPRSCSRW